MIFFTRKNKINMAENLFEILPKDILLYLIKKLDNPSSLFISCKYLNNFGKRFSLRAHEISTNEIKKISPYSSIIGSPQSQLDLIKRGQETVYTIHLDYQEDPDQYSRNRTYILKSIQLGRNREISFDDVTPFFFLKGSPASKSTKFSLFGLAKDTSVVKSDEASVWEENSSRFEFEIMLDSELGKKPSEIWDMFCKDAVETAYRMVKTNMKYKQFAERNEIITELDRIRDQENEKELQEIKGLSRKGIKEYYAKKSFDMDNPYPNTNYNEIFKKLGELDVFHKKQIKELKRIIYNDSEGIISLAKDNLIKQKTYNGYVFDTIIQLI